MIERWHASRASPDSELVVLGPKYESTVSTMNVAYFWLLCCAFILYLRGTQSLIDTGLVLSSPAWVALVWRAGGAVQQSVTAI